MGFLPITEKLSYQTQLGPTVRTYYHKLKKVFLLFLKSKEIMLYLIHFIISSKIDERYSFSQGNKT